MQDGDRLLLYVTSHGGKSEDRDAKYGLAIRGRQIEVKPPPEKDDGCDDTEVGEDELTPREQNR